MPTQAQLFQAIAEDDAQVLATILAQSPRLARAIGRDEKKWPFHFGKTPLMAAILQNKKACVQALIPLSDLDATDSVYGHGALVLAVLSDQADMAEWILAARGGIGLSASEQSAMVEAAGANATRCLALLIEKNKNGDVDKSRETLLLALRMAAKNGQVDASKSLVEAAGVISLAQADKAFSLSLAWGEKLDRRKKGGGAWDCARFFAVLATREAVVAAKDKAPADLLGFFERLAPEALEALAPRAAGSSEAATKGDVVVGNEKNPAPARFLAAKALRRF